MESFALETLAVELNGTPLGSKDSLYTNLQDSRNCDENSLCFVRDSKFLETLSPNAGAVITTEALAKEIICTQNFIIVDNPYLAYAKATQLFFKKYNENNAKIDPEIGTNVTIGKNSVINGNCVIGDNVVIHDNVSIYSCTNIGSNSIIHSGTVIGSDGFGYAPKKEGWEKIAHLGGVAIGSDVEIGANCAIDRGALGNTVIKDGVKFDNHIHIAHNVEIGENTAIAGQSGVAGSVKIGKNCQIAGKVGIVGWLEIADNVTVMAGTLVTKSLKQPGVYSGVMPVQNHKDALKFAAKLKR
jgi:UDP-3-O-[3-hydroxymyristoyl] glucosamine N-acyltransferase